MQETARAAQDNRAFLARAVRFLAQDAGIRQFLDIGTGLPARGHVHEIAREADPMARVVCCDNDPVVVAHANALLADALRQARAVYRGASAPGTARRREDIERFFDGLEMVEPGVVDVAVWHARRSARQIPPALFYAGIGRKPGIPGQP